MGVVAVVEGVFAYDLVVFGFHVGLVVFLVGAGAGEPDFTVGCSDDDSSLRACSVDGRLSPLVLQNSSSMCVFVRGGSFVGAEHW